MRQKINDKLAQNRTENAQKYVLALNMLGATVLHKAKEEFTIVKKIVFMYCLKKRPIT